MKRTYPTSSTLIQTAKVVIATLPAVAILIAGAIAFGTQPSTATARKPVGTADRYPAVIWPAQGAGDFASVAAAMPSVNWPALGAGDFDQVRAAPAPEALPLVVWPAAGAGDFEAVIVGPMWLVGPVTDAKVPAFEQPRWLVGPVIDAKEPARLPAAVWPAAGAGDFAMVQPQPQWLVGPPKDVHVPANAQPEWLVGPVR